MPSPKTAKNTNSEVRLSSLAPPCSNVGMVWHSGHCMAGPAACACLSGARHRSAVPREKIACCRITRRDILLWVVVSFFCFVFFGVFFLVLFFLVLLFSCVGV